MVKYGESEVAVWRNTVTVGHNLLVCMRHPLPLHRVPEFSQRQSNESPYCSSVFQPQGVLIAAGVHTGLHG